MAVFGVCVCVGVGVGVCVCVCCVVLVECTHLYLSPSLPQLGRDGRGWWRE